MTKKRQRPQTNNKVELARTPLRLGDHINELRSRLLFIGAVFLFSSIVGFLIREYLFQILVGPLKGPLYYTSPAGGFNFVVSLSIRFGLLVTIPFFMHQLTLFIRPAFSNNTSLPVMPIVLTSFALMLIGMAFAYLVSIPTALTFLTKFGPNNINSLITAESYLSFISIFILGFGFLFQLPLLMFLINKVVKINIKALLRAQKWVAFSAFVIAAVITPTPDIANQIMMAIPIIILYQISVLTIFFASRRI